MRFLHLSPDALLALMRDHARALEAAPAASSWHPHVAQHLEAWERSRSQRTTAQARLDDATAEAAASEDSARQMLRSLWRDAAQRAGNEAGIPTAEAWTCLPPQAQVEALQRVAAVSASWELPAGEKRQVAWKAHSSALERQRAAVESARAAWLSAVESESRACAGDRSVMVASAHLCADWVDAPALAHLFPASA